MQTLIRSPLFFIYLAVLVNSVAFSLVFPLLPLYAKQFNMSNISIGLLASSFAIAQLFLSPFWGTLSDKFGRKPIIVAGLLGMSASFFVFALAATPLLLFISRFFQGVFSAAVLPSARAYIADITSGQDRVRGMGYVGAFLAAGFIFGPVVGGFLAQHSLSLPFLSAGAVAFLNFLLVAKFLTESLSRAQANPTEKPKEKLSLRDMFSPLEKIWKGMFSPLAPLFIITLLWSFALSNTQVAVPVLSIEKLHLDAAHIGFMFTIMGSVSACVQFLLVDWVTKLFGKHAAAIGGLFVMTLAFTIMPFFSSPFFLYIAAAIVGFGSAITHPVVNVLLSEETKEQQGITMGTASSFESLGRLLGPLLGGFLLSFGIVAPFLGLGFVVAIAILFILISTNFLKRGHVT